MSSHLILSPDSSPLVTIRLAWKTGSAQDSKGREGQAWLAAFMLASGGSHSMSHKQILDAFFPMAVSVSSSVDKEMTAFWIQVHADYLERAYPIFREMLLNPGWREDDFERLRADSVNLLEITLRGENDEELAKEALQAEIFQGRPYAHHCAGTANSLKRLTLEDIREFYSAQYARENLIIGIGGGFPPGFDSRVVRDFAALPLKPVSPRAIPPPVEPERNSLLLIEKPARGVAISFGFPIPVVRGHSDYPALLLATSCLGQHRMSSGRLFHRMRQLRGLNYGDYAYIEAFPGGMYSLQNQQHLCRSRTIFEIWIRPVAGEHALFALRLALHELEKLTADGLTQAEFERGRSFLSKYVLLLARTREEELGFRMDSHWYGIPPYSEYLRKSLASLTLDEVNAAIRRHLRADRVRAVMAGENMAALREAILNEAPSPMSYNSPKPPEILAEDEIVARRALNFAPADVRILPADEMFA
jgi:zinc protease